MPENFNTENEGYIYITSEPSVRYKNHYNIWDRRWENKLLPKVTEGINFVLNEIAPHRNLNDVLMNQLQDFFANENSIDRFRLLHESPIYWISALGLYDLLHDNIAINPMIPKKWAAENAVHEATHKLQNIQLGWKNGVDSNRINLLEKALPTSIQIVNNSDNNDERDATVQQLLYNISMKYNGAVGDELTKIIQDMPLWKLNWMLYNSSGYGIDYLFSLWKNRLTTPETRLEQGQNLKNALIYRKSGGTLNYFDYITNK